MADDISIEKFRIFKQYSHDRCMKNNLELKPYASELNA